MRPKFRGVTSTSTSPPTAAFGSILRALASEISSAGFVTSSTTSNLARARISPVFGLMSMRSSREALTLFFDAERSALETRSDRRVRDVVHHEQLGEGADFAGLRIDVDAQLARGAHTFLRRRKERVGD